MKGEQRGREGRGRRVGREGMEKGTSREKRMKTELFCNGVSYWILAGGGISQGFPLRYATLLT